MHQGILTIQEAAEKITQGRKLLFAGDESVLRKLPVGDWIGGTIPYFMSANEGGMSSRSIVFATDISEEAERITITRYDHGNLSSVFSDAVAHGFSFIIIPARSITHLSFALNAPGYKDFGVRPLVGWISGVHLEDLGQVTPKVFNGQTGAVFNEGALVLHADLVPGKTAHIGIMNLFEPGEGDSLVFPIDGFSARDVLVNGERENFAEYISRTGIDTKLPLVANYNGILANTSFQGVDDLGEEVTFYAPVFKCVVYKHAKPLDNYEEEFNRRLGGECITSGNRILFSCNCILNYLYSELEGKKTGPFTGPITFGEIANRLLNQTLVYLEIQDC